MATTHLKNNWCNIVRVGFTLSLSVGAAALISSNATAAASAPASYYNECAACHIAYPPSMLPAASWNQILVQLNKHFGADASLDSATEKSIAATLIQHAAKSGRMAEAPPQDRITQSQWFNRQHREISAGVWKRTSVKSPSNCVACHADAGKGYFDEDTARIPK